MEEDPKQREQVDKLTQMMKDAYGFVPVVNQVLSARPDLFLASSGLAAATIEGKGDMDQKHRYLCAISAATAVGGEYCVNVQIKHAKDAGATADEVLEAIMIGATMCSTRAQSYALRRYADNYGIEYR